MKTLDKALRPDERFRTFLHDDHVEGLRPITFADHYADVSGLALPAVGVPLVERLDERAQHCLLYAWFDYELTLLAEAQAFSAADLALNPRHRREAGCCAPPRCAEPPRSRKSLRTDQVSQGPARTLAASGLCLRRWRVGHEQVGRPSANRIKQKRNILTPRFASS